jgi:carboxypeptidase Taq
VTAPPSYDTLKTKLSEIHDLVKAGSLLAWDQQTMMPTEGGEMRAQQLATVGKFTHELFISDEIGNLLEELRPYEESLDRDSDDASLIRVARRDFEKATRVPPELSAETTRVGARSFMAWVEARANSDYESFRPWLERMVELKHRYVDCFEPGEDPYDTLLDDYEPGMKTAEVNAIFDRLKEELIPLIADVRDAASPRIHGRFPAAAQRAVSLEIVRRFGYDDRAWRMDAAPHPFASSLGTTDIRLTTREPEDSLDGLFAAMHECGHGLYENGVDRALERTLLCRGASLALHESQSRLWENLVGRSRPFWSWFYPRLQETFADLRDVDEEAWFRSINDVSPGLTRIEADEASYNLHIILRFELEQEIMGGLDLRELPQRWDAMMDEYLGIEVPDDAHGVLQDVHWSRGGFGYFPTYSLGNVISVQIWERMLEDVADVDEQMARGDFRDLREWLRAHLHRYGRKFLPAETLERVVGGPIDAEPYLRYLQSKLARA